MTEEQGRQPPHPATVPYTCESADLFIRMGDEQKGAVFVLGDSTKSFYSFWYNEIYKYAMPGLEVTKHKLLSPTQSVLYFCPLDETAGWLFTATHDSNLIANLIDTALNITFVKDLKLFPGILSIAATADKGFVIATNLYETEQYSVLRYSRTGSLMWRKDLFYTDYLRAIVALKDGGFLVGGSRPEPPDYYENDFLTKLNSDGKELWTKSVHSGDKNGKYTTEDVIEDDSGDYFLLLAKEPGLTELLRTDSAYNIRWSTQVDGRPKLFRSNDGILVLSSQNNMGSSDIVFESYGDNGDMRWRNQFGGTGHELGSCVSNIESGYYIIGSTNNWPEAGYLGVNRAYLIKTDLEGRSCQ
jgi:hypothetical protein